MTVKDQVALKCGCGISCNFLAGIITNILDKRDLEGNGIVTVQYPNNRLFF